MSYCHLFGGCGVTNVFHPLSISLAVGPDIDAAVGQCIFPPSRFFTLSPCRLIDTRTAVSPLGGPALVASGRRNFTLTNVCGIPTTAKAISVNLTVTSASAPGFVSLFPGDGIPPATSNINFSVGQTRANNAVVFLATNGTGSLATLNGAAGTVHFILDVNGYFQ
jgi:hypothetical protein